MQNLCLRMGIPCMCRETVTQVEVSYGVFGLVVVVFRTVLLTVGSSGVKVLDLCFLVEGHRLSSVFDPRLVRRSDELPVDVLFFRLILSLHSIFGYYIITSKWSVSTEIFHPVCDSSFYIYTIFHSLSFPNLSC